MRRLLRPVIRFALSRSLKFQDLTLALKEEFLELAKAELKDSQLSVSKLSVLTGLQRKDVQSLLSEENPRSSESKNFITRVIGLWGSSPRFTSNSGRARKLTTRGKNSEFAELVASVNSDLSHVTILAELKRLQLVEVGDNFVKLLRTSVPIRDEFPAFVAGAQDAEDIFRAVEANIAQPEEPPHLHIRSSFDNIPKTKLPHLKKKVSELVREFHIQVHALLAAHDRDISAMESHSTESTSSTDRTRMTVGTFSFSEDLGGEDHEK